MVWWDEISGWKKTEWQMPPRSSFGQCIYLDTYFLKTVRNVKVPLFPTIVYYIYGTWVSWCLKSPTMQAPVSLLVQGNDEEKFKLRTNCPWARPVSSGDNPVCIYMKMTTIKQPWFQTLSNWKRLYDWPTFSFRYAVLCITWIMDQVISNLQSFILDITWKADIDPQELSIRNYLSRTPGRAKQAPGVWDQFIPA